ncbi:glycosyltransferase family 4 protein [archaeon]|nr:glycosyltransferase family 4 protein [archaeon]
MKIAVVARYFPPHDGGVENAAFEIADYMSAKGHEVRVFTSNEPPVGSGKVGGVECLRYSYFRLANEPVYRFARDLISFKPDVIHDHYPNPWGYSSAYRTARKNKIPMVVTYHALPSSSPSASAFGKLFGSARFFPTAKKLARVVYTFKSLGPALPNSCVVPNGVDTRKFRPLNSRRDFDLLYVGRLAKVKRLDWMIRAASEINASLAIVGDGPELENLQKLSDELKAEVAFFGRKPNEETPKYYARAKVAALTSKSEGFPLTAIEAIACGCVLVSTPVGALPEITKNENLFKTYKEFKAVLARALNQKPEPLPPKFRLVNVCKEYEEILSKAAGVKA